MKALILLLALAAPARSLPTPDEVGFSYFHGFAARNGSQQLGQRYSMLAQSVRWRFAKLETRVGRFHRPSTGGLAGVAAGLELRPLSWSFVEAGAGTLWTDFAGLELRFNFDLFAGAGVQVPLSSAWALRLGYRFHHVSNAGLRQPNAGLNGHVPYFGISVAL